MDMKAVMKLGKCVVCRKKAGTSARPNVNLSVGCMRRGKRKDDVGAFSETEANQFALLFSVSYNPGDPERELPQPRRRASTVDVELPFFRLGQGEVNFCSTACLRRWLNRLVDQVERHAEIGRSKRDPIYRATKFTK